jgi:N-acetylneuraminic acid mutarotase
MSLVSGGAASEMKWRSGAPLPEPRAGLIASEVSGKLLVAGGTFWSADRKHWSARCDLFNPASGNWQAGPVLPAPRADSAVAHVAGEVLFLGGTSDGVALAEVWSFRDFAWHTKPDMRLPAPRSYAQAAVHGGSLYVLGGLEKAGDIASARRQVWVWRLDRPREGWQHVTDIPEPARSNYAFAVMDGKAYLFGGVAPEGAGFRNLSQSWSYDLNANEWEALPDVPQATRAWSAVTWDGEILLLGGYTDKFTNAVLAYAPASRAFANRGTLPRALADAAFVRLDGRIFMTGGESGVKIRSGETWEGLVR